MSALFHSLGTLPVLTETFVMWYMGSVICFLHSFNINPGTPSGPFIFLTSSQSIILQISSLVTVISLICFLTFFLSFKKPHSFCEDLLKLFIQKLTRLLGLPLFYLHLSALLLFFNFSFPMYESIEQFWFVLKPFNYSSLALCASP